MSRKMSNEKLYAKLSAIQARTCDAALALDDLSSSLPAKMQAPYSNVARHMHESTATLLTMIDAVKAVLDYQAKILGAETSDESESGEAEASKLAAE